MRQTEANRRPKGGRIMKSSSRRARSEQTELLLLRTATWLFSERGFHGTGIRDIADAAGVAVSATYYYASSKDEVLEDVMHRTLDVLISSSEQTLNEIDDPAERLAALIAVHVAFHARNPRAAKVADHEFSALAGEARRDVLRKRDSYEAVWQGTLEAGESEGIFTDHGTAARLALLQMVTGVAHWYRPRGSLSVAELCSRFADMGLALVRARRGDHLLTVADVDLPDTDVLVQRVELPIEPRRKPAGL